MNRSCRPSTNGFLALRSTAIQTGPGVDGECHEIGEQTRGTLLHWVRAYTLGLFVVSGREKSRRGVQCAINSGEQPEVDGPPEYLVMNPMPFQVRGANHSALIGERAEAFEEGGSRHPSVRKRRHI